MKRRVVTVNCYSIIMGLLISIVMPTYAQMQWLSQARQSASAVVNRVNVGLSALLDKSGKFADSLATQSAQKIDQWIDKNWELIKKGIPLIQKELRKEALTSNEKMIVVAFTKNAIPIIATMVAIAVLALNKVVKEVPSEAASWFERARQKVVSAWQSSSDILKRGLSSMRQSLGRAKNITFSLLTKSPSRITEWVAKEWQLVSKAVPLLKKKEPLTQEEERILISFRNRAIGIVVVIVALAVTAATVYSLKKSDRPLSPEEAPIPPRLQIETEGVPFPERVAPLSLEEIEGVSLPERVAPLTTEVTKGVSLPESFEPGVGVEQPAAIMKEPVAIPVEHRLPTAAELQELKAGLKKVKKPEVPVKKPQILQEGTIAEALGGAFAGGAGAPEAGGIKPGEVEVVAMEKRKLPGDLETVRANVKADFEKTKKSFKDKREYKNNLIEIDRKADRRLEKAADRKIKEEAQRIFEVLERAREQEIKNLEKDKEKLEGYIERGLLGGGPAQQQLEGLKEEIKRQKNKKALEEEAKKWAEDQRSAITNELKQSGEY